MTRFFGDPTPAFRAHATRVLVAASNANQGTELVMVLREKETGAIACIVHSQEPDELVAAVKPLFEWEWNWE